MIVVNLSDAPAQARIPVPWPELAGRHVRLVDVLQRQRFERSGAELLSPGLFVDLPAWGFHLLAVDL